MNLNVNIDHLATLRNARGGNEPDPITGALIAELAGATGIVCHLREDRRHINDRDVRLLRELVKTRLDFEMAATEEIIKIALETKPELVTIVPEKREELTTEGGLDVAKNITKYKKLCDLFHSNDIEVSYFIEPSEEQIAACITAGADMVELHTGVYANAKDAESINLEMDRIVAAAEFAFESGLQVAAGHGLNYLNVNDIADVFGIQELSIGHSIVSRAVFVGMTQAVKEMLEAMHRY